MFYSIPSNCDQLVCPPGFWTSSELLQALKQVFDLLMYSLGTKEGNEGQSKPPERKSIRASLKTLGLQHKSVKKVEGRFRRKHKTPLDVTEDQETEANSEAEAEIRGRSRRNNGCRTQKGSKDPVLATS